MTSAVQRPRILLVEDYDDAREMYSEYLTFSGFDMVQAADGMEAIRQATATMPNIVVMDLSLPEMDGWETTRRLKADERTSHIPILALTGHVLADFSRRAKDAGFEGFLTKPCLPEELVAEIHRILADKRPK